jgi:hypothetical protein
MYIITNKSIMFRNLIIEKNATTGENIATVNVKDGDDGVFTVQANSAPQFVPDWVKKDPMYDISVKDGAIMEIEIKDAAAAKAPPIQTEQAGWQSKPAETGLESK